MIFSPTPWTLDMDAEERGIEVRDADGGSVCNCFLQDAHLLAAAPDLLAALTAIVESLASQDSEGLLEYANEMIAARAAIKKAEGV